MPYCRTIFFVYCCKVCCIWQTQVCVTRLHVKFNVSFFLFFRFSFCLHYCKTYYHWYQKIWLPELQFLSQKSLQHSHFLCVVMCAVLHKSKFPSKQCSTQILVSVFLLHYCKTYYHWYQKIWLPELQFLLQKSLQHSHFLCIVATCAVLYKSKFSNSATHKFSFKFFLHYCKTFYHFFKKHGCLNYSFCRQNNCNTPIFLCVVATCAVFCKRRFPNKFTCKMSLTFSNSISYWRNNTTVFAVYNFCNEGKLQMRKKQRKPLLNFSLQTSFVVLQYFYNRKKLRVTHLC